MTSSHMLIVEWRREGGFTCLICNYKQGDYDLVAGNAVGWLTDLFETTKHILETHKELVAVLSLSDERLWSLNSRYPDSPREEKLPWNMRELIKSYEFNLVFESDSRLKELYRPGDA